MTTTRSLRQLFIALFLFVLVLGWALVQMNERFVNDKGWSSYWLNPQTWLMPLANHQPLGQIGVNLSGLNDMYFIDAQHGWVLGRDGIILATEDGGQSWQIQSSGVTTWLGSIHFTDAQHGWAVGVDGVIIATDNGGKQWQVQASGMTTSLRSVQFSDAQHGWAVGASGVILSTSNGGQSWQLQISGVTTALNSVHFTDAQHGWVVGDEGVIRVTDNGGLSWQPQSSRTKEKLESIIFTDQQHGWVLSDRVIHNSDGSMRFKNHDVILTTDNGGRNWMWQFTGLNKKIDSIYFVDAQHGWAVGKKGVILATENGRSWKPQISNIETDIKLIHFINTQQGWAIGEDGIIVVTNNGGRNWRRQTSGVKESLRLIQFTDTQHGWVLGDRRLNKHSKIPVFSTGEVFILATDNGGRSWWQQTTGVNTGIESLYFIDAQHGWAVGGNGLILATDNGGHRWQRQTGENYPLMSVRFIDTQHGVILSFTPPAGMVLTTDNGGRDWQRQNNWSGHQFKSIYFIDTQRCWAVNDFGDILATDNGGNSWRQQTSSHINSLYFTDVQHGWAAGDLGIILATNNGGSTWQNISPPPEVFGEQSGGGRAKLAIYPSPLASLLLILSVGLVFGRVYHHWSEPRSLQGGISDAPIDSAEDDRLGRLELVKTLADLIRNRDTVPPLAIAITAPWGSGKSSMLGLLREELKNEVFAVQLNAWHYRDDGQLLAALMEHIREQALPPLLSLDNLLFRARLLQQRWFSGVGLRTLTVLLVVVIAAVFFARQQDWQVFSDWLSKGQKSLDLPIWLSASVDLPWFNTVSVLLAGLVSFRALKAGYASLNAFSPELVAFATQLGKSSREAVQVADWAKDAGLRFRFAKDFEEVAQALGKGRLLLLIDDLDRCEPKQIETVMSTLNFLFSSSAPCYAVLAMDWGYVTDALGLAFKDIAAARRDTDTKGKAFAEHYVEKIVQISIDLPAVDGSRVALVDNSQPRSTAVVVWWQTLESVLKVKNQLSSRPSMRFIMAI